MADEENFSLEDNGICLVFGEIDNSTSEEITKFILEQNFKGTAKHLTLIVNSVGGSLIDAFAIIDMMKGSAIPIHTVGIGCIASCGLLIFMAGVKGKRVLTPNTSILSHQFTWGTFGKQHELVATQKEFDLTNARMLEHYKACTGLDEKVIREKLLPPEDVWLSAHDAKKLNLCDTVKELGGLATKVVKPAKKVETGKKSQDKKRG